MPFQQKYGQDCKRQEFEMDRKILKTAFTMDDLEMEELNKLDIGIEIQDFTEPNLSPGETLETINFYKEKLINFKGIKSMHGPFLDLKPASPDKRIRALSFQIYLEAIQIAKELKVDYLIFHSQINPYLNDPIMKKLNNKQSKDAWVKILEEIPDYKGTILIENIFEETPAMLKERIETIDLPNIRINLDLGHAKLGTASLEEWIKELKDCIAYIHVHSNDGVHDLHNAPSPEEINQLYELLDKYAINPVLSLEYKTENIEKEIDKMLQKK